MAAPEVVVSGITRATTLAKAASLTNRAYVTFLAGNGDYVKGVVGLANSLRKVKTAYPLVVAVLPDVPEEHRCMLGSQGCIVREIEPVYPPENQTQFAMAYSVINYSKLRIWEFVEYHKMIYLDADNLVFQNIDHLFDNPNGYFYAVKDCFCEKTWSHTPQYQIGYCQQCPDKVQWPAELGPKPPLYFNAGMFMFEPSLSICDDLLETLKITPPTPFAEQDFLNMFFKDAYKPIPRIYNLVLAMLWHHPENIELDKVKVVQYCASSITLIPALKGRQLTTADTAMESTEVATAIVRSSILLVDAARLAEQSDIAIFSQALHFSLVGLFSMHEAIVCHNRLTRAADKIKMSNDWQVKKIKELELQAIDAEWKAAEAMKTLQSMDLMLKSLEQENGSLKAEKEQLANALATSKDNLECAIKAAKDEGCNEATAVYEVQFAKLENMLFEDGWTSALEAANVPADSDLRKNVPYPHLETAEH